MTTIHNTRSKKNVTYLWSYPSGYIFRCVDELAKRSKHNISLISFQPSRNAPFAAWESRSLSYSTLSDHDRRNYSKLSNTLLSKQPDIVIFAGWRQKNFTRLLWDRRFKSTKFILAADTQLLFTWRQFFGRFKLFRILRRVSGICVPGDRSFLLMRYWNVPARKIYQGLYAVDDILFSQPPSHSISHNRTFAFRYVGRYVRQKGLDVLLKSYDCYRKNTLKPHILTLSGAGPLETFSGPNDMNDGVTDLGFLQPADVAKLYTAPSVLVLPSRYEPWGQVIVEAMMSGVPVICTSACGASAAIVRHLHNGYIVKDLNISSLSTALTWFHHNIAKLPAMALAAQSMAAAHTTANWCNCQENMIDDIMST